MAYDVRHAYETIKHALFLHSASLVSYSGERAVLPESVLPPPLEHVAVPVPLARVQLVLPPVLVVGGRLLLGETSWTHHPTGDETKSGCLMAGECSLRMQREGRACLSSSLGWGYRTAHRPAVETAAKKKRSLQSCKPCWRSRSQSRTLWPRAKAEADWAGAPRCFDCGCLCTVRSLMPSLPPYRANLRDQPVTVSPPKNTRRHDFCPLRRNSPRCCLRGGADTRRLPSALPPGTVPHASAAKEKTVTNCADRTIEFPSFFRGMLVRVGAKSNPGEKKEKKSSPRGGVAARVLLLRSELECHQF